MRVRGPDKNIKASLRSPLPSEVLASPAEIVTATSTTGLPLSPLLMEIKHL